MARHLPVLTVLSYLSILVIGQRLSFRQSSTGAQAPSFLRPITAPAYDEDVTLAWFQLTTTSTRRTSTTTSKPADRCPNNGDLLFSRTQTCFELVPSDKIDFLALRMRQQSLAGSAPTAYQLASAYCSGRGKQLGVIRSLDEQLFLANISRTLGYRRVLLGLRRQRTLWKWIGERSFQPLSNQGCFEAEMNQEIDQSSWEDSEMSRARCFRYCSSLADDEITFAGLAGGTRCFCSKGFPWYRQSSRCSRSCSNRQDFCGSTDGQSLNLYQIRSPRKPDEEADWVPPFDNWFQGQPWNVTSDPNPKLCGFADASANFQWFAGDCRALRLAFVCQFAAGDEPTEEYLLPKVTFSSCLTDKCFVLFADHLMNFDEADAFCMTYRGRLASVQSREVQNTLRDMVRSAPEYSNLRKLRFWIGATASDYTWPDASAAEPYDTWATNEPPEDVDDSGKALHEDCVQMAASYPHYGWVTIPCQDIPNEAFSASAFAFLCSGPLLSAFNGSGYAPLISKNTVLGDYLYQPEIVGTFVRQVGPLGQPAPTLPLPMPKSTRNNSTSQTTTQSYVEIRKPLIVWQKVPNGQIVEVSPGDPRLQQNILDPANSTAEDPSLAANVEAQKDGAGDKEDSANRPQHRGVPPWAIFFVVLIGLAILASLTTVTVLFAKGRLFHRIAPS